MVNNIYISVVICTYNRAESLADTLESLLGQTNDSTFGCEILLVDNNSTDNTRDVAKLYLKKFSGKLRYIIESQQGLSYARNRGILEAKGQIVSFTDDDVIVDDKWLESIRTAFCLHNPACVGGKVCPKYNTPKPEWLTLEGPYRFSGPIVSHDLGDDFIIIKKETGYKPLPIGANISFKKDVFLKYGLYNTKYGRKGKNLIGGEDTELCIRLYENNEIFLYAPNVIIHHKVEEHRLTKSYFTKWSFWSAYSLSVIIPCEAKKIFNVPRYLIKELILYFFRWLAAGRDIKKEFYMKMRFLFVLGSIAGRFTSPASIYESRKKV